MVYIALLRGINVGGNNKIDMKQLKVTFELAGMNSVTTYINTGNIIFTSNDQSVINLTEALERAITTDFGLQIKVVIRSLEEIKLILEAIPVDWTNDDRMKSDVMFLWDEINDESILEQLVIKSDIDTVIFVPGAVLWSVAKQNVSKSGMNNIVGSKIYRKITVRNVNTTRKIFELMQATK